MSRRSDRYDERQNIRIPTWANHTGAFVADCLALVRVWREHATSGKPRAKDSALSNGRMYLRFARQRNTINPIFQR